MKREAGKTLGIAVIGAGRIGTLRARLAAKHPSVAFMAIADIDPARAKALADQTGADLHTADNFAATSDFAPVQTSREGIFTCGAIAGRRRAPLSWPLARISSPRQPAQVPLHAIKISSVPRCSLFAAHSLPEIGDN
jgi:hypothetical protein